MTTVVKPICNIGTAAPRKGKSPIAKTPCRFNLSNRCNRGDHCILAHLPSIATPTPMSKHKPCTNEVPTQTLWQPRNMSIQTGIRDTTHDTTNKATTKAKGKIMGFIAASGGEGVHHNNIVKPWAKIKTTKLQLVDAPGVWTTAQATHRSENQWPKILFAMPG